MVSARKTSILLRNFFTSSADLNVKTKALMKTSALAEDKGFEPSHRLTGLTHFECAPFDHLGNPPLLCSNRKYYKVRLREYAREKCRNRSAGRRLTQKRVMR